MDTERKVEQWALKMKEGAMSQGMQAVDLQKLKRTGSGFCLQLPEGTLPCQPIFDFGPPEQ